MITKKQYLEAKNIVKKYEEQKRKKTFKHHFTIKDIEVLLNSMLIPILTKNIVDEDFVKILEEELENGGLEIDWVSLDDFGFISIKLIDKILVEKEHVNVVLKVLNNIFNKN